MGTLNTKEFLNKKELIEAYAEELRFDSVEFYGRNSDNKDLSVFVLSAARAAKYVPHLYNGGWFIAGFGYSIERKHVLTEKSKKAARVLVHTYRR